MAAKEVKHNQEECSVVADVRATSDVASRNNAGENLGAGQPQNRDLHVS